MSSHIRVRFAPSPTGQVHIGNIRTAIFNYLFARSGGGEFLLRVEDTDLERSTQDAVDKLLDCMRWLGLDYDGDIYRQSRHSDEHSAAAEKLLADGKAYKPSPKDGESVPTIFMIPWDTDGNPHVRIMGDVKLAVHPDTPLTVSASGVSFAMVSKKGKPIPTTATLAGFHDLKARDSEGRVVFDINDSISDILAGTAEPVVENCAEIAFQRRSVFFDDVIKGRMEKPLDTMKDLIIVRSDGSPVFHLANVFDDIAQGVTHVIRGDDHVENTYRHIFLFQALDADIPKYGHMPMIVNERGKPFSKRDGDAFVGDFRSKGYLPEALFNYLAFLGWSPGDDRDDRMSKEELVDAFSLDRVISSPAKFDFAKLANLNGRHIAALSTSDFTARIAEFAKEAGMERVLGWIGDDPAKFADVAELMKPRVKTLADVADWAFLFEDDVEIDVKLAEKALKPDVMPAIARFAELAAELAEFTEESIEKAIAATAESAGLAPGKLMRPLRVAATGAGSGADLIPLLLAIGRDRTVARLRKLRLPPALDA